MNWYKTAVSFKEVIDNTSPNDRIFMTRDDSFNFRDESGNQGISLKPNGLWYACGAGWLEFVQREWQSEAEKNIFKIEINPSSMLMIDNGEDFVNFSKEFGIKDSFVQQIDWSRVASMYSGIEISPYQARYRMSDEHGWYYPWDIASGCIWGADGILGVEMIHDDVEAPLSRVYEEY